MKSNIEVVIGGQLNKLKEFITPDNQQNLMRTIAVSMLPVIHDRIHVQGLAADGTPIGTYSKGYMVVRTGAYKNATKFSRGKNTGKNKDAGTFTDRTIRVNRESGIFTGEEKVGTARPVYNRGSDTKVILSLTRQMENDFSTVATEKGYGLGFKNEDNFNKANWAEKTYNKKIYGLTPSEKETVSEIAKEEVLRAIS